MEYKKAIIYFLSGTGNSYRVAVWLHDACRSRNIASEVIPINLAKPKEEIQVSPETLVALAYPTHGFLPPWSAIKFLFKMPLKRGVHFFCTPTRGCFRVGPIAVPGIAALASMLPTILLPFKGYRIRGSASFDMPANMISLHPRLREKNILRILFDARARAEKLFERLLSGKSVWFTLNNLWEYFWGILLLAYFPLFPIAYLLLGRFFMGKIMFANSDCNGCGVCAKSCPNSAIAMMGREDPRPYWRYNCEACLRCMNYCQQKAVEAGHSWAAILWLLGSFSLSAYLFRFAADIFPQIDYVKSWLVLDIVNCIYYYPVFIIAYFIFFNLIRIKPINKLFTWTTLTHFYPRYNEPDTALNDLLRKRSDPR